MTVALAEAAGRRAPDLRGDLAIIADMVAPNSRVLDVGCADGALLAYLVHEKQVDGRGVELSQDGVNACVEHGLSVIQGDADTDLANYPSGSFDYVILSQTLQATVNPRRVLSELVRIGRRAIVSFPNFGHWRVRWYLLAHGRMPHAPLLNHHWYDTPNIHLCTIDDFVELAAALDIEIERGLTLDRHGRATAIRRPGRRTNLFGEQGLFLLRSPGRS